MTSQGRVPTVFAQELRQYLLLCRHLWKWWSFMIMHLKMPKILIFEQDTVNQNNRVTICHSIFPGSQKKHAKTNASLQWWKSISALHQRHLQLVCRFLSRNLDGTTVRNVESHPDGIEEQQWVLFFSKVRLLHSIHLNGGYQLLHGTLVSPGNDRTWRQHGSRSIPNPAF